MNAFMRGESIYLRPLEESDADGDYPSWLNDAEVCGGNSHHRYPYTRSAAREYIARAAKSRDEIVLAVVTSEAGRHVGNVALKRIDPISRSAEFTVLIGAKDLWGHGVGKDAGRLMLDHGFFALNLHRVYCGTFSTNAGMQKLAESLGMRLEGTRRQAVFKDDQWLDVLEYGVLKPEYVAKVHGERK